MSQLIFLNQLPPPSTIVQSCVKPALIDAMRAAAARMHAAAAAGAAPEGDTQAAELAYDEAAADLLALFQHAERIGLIDEVLKGLTKSGGH